MKKTFFIIIFIIFISGCGNFNPRLQNRIANENGKIEDIRNNQNGFMLELGKLRNEAQIQNSQLKEVQQGMLNMNNALSRNENSGIQILQGDGSLMLIFALASIGMLLFHYRNKANNNEKIAIPRNANIKLCDYINNNTFLFIPIYPLPFKVVYRIYIDDGHNHSMCT